MRWLKSRPAVALFFLAPVFGELFSGSAPLNEFINPVTALGLALLYGSGAILIREWVVRRRKGWPSLLLLGLAYGIYEEGLVVRSFFDPQWMDLGPLATYGRVMGVNWVWAVHLTIYHAVVSIMVSIAFTEMLYPRLRHTPWVENPRWRWALWAALLVWLPLGKALAPYDAPDVWILVTWTVLLLLLLLARWAPNPPARAHPSSPPRPLFLFLVALFGTFLHFAIVYVGAEGGTYPFPVAIGLLLAADFFFLRLILRWRNRRGWDDRHRMALILGTMSFFLWFPLLIGPEAPIMYVSNPIFFLVLLWTYFRIRKRVARTMGRGSDQR